MSELQCDLCGATSWPYRQAGAACGWRQPSGKFCGGIQRDVRDQSRLARCAAESRRLSLEECCYWLCVTWADQRLIGLLVRRQPMTLREEIRDYRSSARYWLTLRHRSTEPSREVTTARKYLFTAWLCREALRRIGEERR